MTDSKTAKYKHPFTDNTWTGKGQQPKWVELTLAENKYATLECLEVGHKNYGSFIPVPVKEAVTVLDKYDTGSVKKALAAVKADGGTEGTYYNIPHKRLRVDPAFNIRDHSEDYLRHRKWLGEQIAENGYDRTKPMTGYVVKNDETGLDEFFLTDGFTRYGAIADQIAKGKLPEDFIVPVIQPNQGTSKEDMTVSLFTSNTGRQLTPMELARVFKRLIGYGWDEKRIGLKFDFTVPYVRDMLSLLEMPASIREKVTSGKLAATEAVKVVKKVGGNKAEKVLDEAAVKAKAAGKTKITAKHIKGEGDARPKRESVKVAAQPDLVEQAHTATVEAVKEQARDAIVQGVSAALITPMQLIKDMMAYIKDVMLETDDDAKALLGRAEELLTHNEARVAPASSLIETPEILTAAEDDEI